MNICPICKNENWLKAYKVKQWDIVECSGCHLARVDNPTLGDRRKDIYSKEKVIARNVKKKSKSQNFSRFMKRMFKKMTKRNKLKIFYEGLSRQLPNGAKVLDVGCGDGSFLKLLKDRFSCTGVEISEYLADLARKAGIEVFVGDFTKLDLADKKYDGITLISIIEHLDAPWDALKKCFDIMDEKGILLLKTVNYSCFNRKIKGKDWTGLRPPDHLVYFSPVNLKGLLKKIGFSKIRISAWPFNDNMYCTAWK